TQVVRERSAKPLCVGSTPTRASILSSTYNFKHLQSQNQKLAAVRLPMPEFSDGTDRDLTESSRCGIPVFGDLAVLNPEHVELCHVEGLAVFARSREVEIDDNAIAFRDR